MTLWDSLAWFKRGRVAYRLILAYVCVMLGIIKTWQELRILFGFAAGSLEAPTFEPADAVA